MIGILPAPVAAETKESTSPRTVPVLVVVNHLACGVAARRSRMTDALLSPGLAATHLAALVSGST